MDSITFSTSLFLDAPSDPIEFSAQPNEVLRDFEGDECLRFYDVRIKTDPIELDYYEPEEANNKPKSLFRHALDTMQSCWYTSKACLFRPEVSRDAYQRSLFHVAQLPEIDNLLVDLDMDRLPSNLSYSYSRLIESIKWNNPESPYAKDYRDYKLNGNRFDDLIEEFYISYEGNYTVWSRQAREFVLEHLAYAFMMNVGLTGVWQVDLPRLYFGGEKFLTRQYHLPWLSLYSCDYHNHTVNDLGNCISGCRYDLLEFRHFLFFFYAKWLGLDCSTFSRMIDCSHDDYFVDGEPYTKRYVNACFSSYFRHNKIEPAFPTLGSQSQYRACKAVTKQINKMTKISDAKRARKAERQLRHIERRAFYKIERSKARDEKFYPTLGVVGISKRVYAAGVHFTRGFRALLGSEQDNALIERWLFMCATLLVNPNPGGLFTAFLWLLNNLGISCFQAAKDLMHYCSEFVTRFAKTALSKIDVWSDLPQHPTESAGIEQAVPSLGDVDVLTNSNLLKLEQIVASHGLRAPALLATILAGASATVAAYMVGTKPTSSRFKLDSWDRLISGCSNLSKFKAGAYAYVSIMRDFCSWVYALVEDNIMDGQDATLVKLVKNVDLEDVPAEGFEKAKFFEMYAFITNSQNLSLVITSSEWRKKAHYCERVLQSINQTLSQTAVNDRETVIARDITCRMLAAVQKVTQSAFKNHTENFSRMRPAVFMFQGKPGVGKSVFTPMFANGILDLLYKKNEFEVPAESSQRMLSVNFSDRFLTSYKNQYCLIVDDIFQDRDGALEGTSSALQFIGWVSNCPYATVQADLNSKGILFESKMIIGSSNIAEPTSNSIQCQDALIRRIDYQIRVEIDESAAADPLMGGRKLRFDIHKPREVAPGNWKLILEKSIFGVENLIIDATRFYIDHFRKEKHILETRNLQPQTLDDLYSKIFGSEFESQEERFVPTGGYISKQVDSVRSMFSKDHFEEYRKYNDNYSCYRKALELGWIRYSGGVFEHGDEFAKLPEDIKSSVQEILCMQDEMDCLDSYFMSLLLQPKISPSIWNRYHAYLTTKLEKLSQTKMGRCFSALINEFGGKAKVLLGGLGLVGVAAAGISLYNYFNKPTEDVFEEYPTGVRYDSGRPRRAAKRSKASRAFASAGMFDARDDPSADTVMGTLINHSSLVKISFTTDKTFAQTAIRLKNTCILTNEHFFTFMIQAFKEIGKRPKFTLAVPINGTVKYVEEFYCPEKLCVFPNKDVAVYNCSNAMPAARSIVHFFPPADLELPETTRCAVMRTSNNAFNTSVDSCSNGLFARFNQVQASYQYPDLNGNMRPFVMSDSWLVNFSGKLGDSGSLLVATNRQMREKLLGIQSSVGERSGTFFEPINQDDLITALETVKCGEPVLVNAEEVIASLGVDMDYDPPSLISKESLVYMGQLIDNNKALAPPGTTKLTTSLVFDEETSTMGPSVMRERDPRLENDECVNLLRFNMQGYDSHIGAVDQLVLEDATEELAQYLSDVYRVDNIPPRLLDEVEMINGTPGVYKEVDMTTSPGFPFVKNRKRPDLKGKMEWFEEYEDPHSGRKMYSMKEELRARIEFREREAREGRRLADSFGYTCLKDEKRTHEKIKNGKTRVFICLPMDYNLLIRKYFAAFVASQHQRAAQPGIASCVGIDPLHAWKTIHTELCKKNVQWEDFDYANWDQSLHPAFFEAYARIVSKFYGDTEDSENHRVRSVLMHELCYTFLIMNNSLVYKTCGQCSGCAVTAEINCIIHELLMLYSYKLFWKRNGVDKDIIDFHSSCDIRVYGDDILFATNEENGFCGAEHRLIAEELGMRITTAQKDMNFRVKNPEECTFLKRSFVKDPRFPGEIMCPIKTSVIEEIPNWIHKCDDELEATIVNINCALLEAFLCGKDYFNKLRSTLVRRLESKIPSSSGGVNTYKYYLDQYMKGEFKVLALREDIARVSETETMRYTNSLGESETSF